MDIISSKPEVDKPDKAVPIETKVKPTKSVPAPIK